MRTWLRSDTGVYTLSGVFAILVYVVAVGALTVRTPVELDSGELRTFTVGFLLFVAVYFVSMAIYRGIDSREPE